ncbi:MAG TPA: glycoside hydrolase family 2 TIM barrel-domain containing protein [Devosia sp.]|nr:glycoside hydrolase family 2 TIM barrel-domain containing protein [Devosia sp.]
MTDTTTLHPRPRLTRDRWFDLNGPWQFAHDDADAGLMARWQVEGPFERTITVPFAPETELSGIHETGFHPVLWYRRTFETPALLPGEHLLIHFGAVDYRARVWVNGDLVAMHEGGNTPFSADITASLRPDGEQVVVVRAEDSPTDIMQPRGKQDWLPDPHNIWYHRTSGIWQSVWLEPVPAVHITEFQLTPDIATNSVKVEAMLSGALSGSLWIVLSLRGQRLAAQQVAIEGSAFETTIAIPAAQNGVHRNDLYWTPERPNLIDVNASLLDATGAVVDHVDSYFGLRTAAVAHGRFLLNDKPYYVRSVLEQGYWPQSNLTAPTPDALRREVELIKSLGFNAVRIHQKVEDPRFHYWADHLGLLVWGEMANAYGFSPDAVARFTREWLDVVKRDRSHPCVVTWVPLNESWGVSDIALRADQQDYARALYRLTKALDPSRPVVSNDGWELVSSDIWAIHDYTHYPEQIIERFGSKEAVAATLRGVDPLRRRVVLDTGHIADQPVMITEFGGLSLAPKAGEAWHGYATASDADEYFQMVKGLFDAIYACPEVSGFCYTQITDTLQETNGLLDANREPKLPVEKLREVIGQLSRAIPSEANEAARKKGVQQSGGQKVE